MPKEYGQACPVARTLEVVGDRWTLLLVRDLLPGTRRFQDLTESLRGIAPNVLSDRLKWMERHGLVARSFYSDHPPRAQYSLTDKGRELGLVVAALADWGARHAFRRAHLVHEDCGHPVKLGYFCAACGGRVRGATVRLRRSPGPAGEGRLPRSGRTPRRRESAAAPPAAATGRPSRGSRAPRD